MAFIEVLLTIVTFIVGIIIYYKWAFTFWERRNLPVLKPTIPFGTMENPFTRKISIGEVVKNKYNEIKSQGFKHAGIYSFIKPDYVPVNLELVKNILQKDFQFFTERGFYHNEKDDPLSANLFAIGGQKWRNLRTKLTPTFTSGKMKMMFEILVQCSEQMVEALANLPEKEPIDIKENLGRYTTDVIGSCAFGLECNSFKSPDAEFRKYGKKIFERPSAFRLATIILAFIKPDLARKLGVRFFPEDVTKFFMKVVKDTVSFREENNIVRKDMLQLLIDLKNSPEHQGENLDEVLSIAEIAAQAFVFFLAGFETSSTTMTFCLFELAKHPEIQQKLRNEINEVLAHHDGKITYDSIMEMKYMGQVIDETLRKYPPLPFLTRKSVADYKVPDTNVVIPNGINVLISVLGIHHDPEYYPEPGRFDPGRFTDEERQKRAPFTFLPFGEGPRNCIGLRFGLMQTKVGLTNLLRNYKFSVNKKTVDPLVMDRLIFILTSETGIYLDAENIRA